MSSPQPEVPVLRVSEPRDLVAMVPYRLGFVPERSLVLVGLRGPRSRVGLVLRVDLPVADDIDALADQVTHYLRGDAADRAVAVVYSDDADDAVDAHAALLDAVRTSLRRHRIGLTDAWQVGPDRYRSLTCTDPRCCPVDGWPVSDLQGSRVSAEMVALGVAVAPSRAQLLPDLSPLGATQLRAVEQVVQAGALGPDDDGAAWRSEGLAAWRGLLEAEQALQVPEEPRTVRPLDGVRRQQWIGSVLARLGDPWVRDALLLTAVRDAGDVPDVLAAEGPQPRTRSVLDGVFGPGEPVAPDQDLLDAVRAALVHLVRHATGPRRAAPLAAMAWAAWWEGDGASAGELADLALSADPANGLAHLVEAAVLAGMAPAWAALDRDADLRGPERTG